MANMYVESRDYHQYLDYPSSHPNHIKCLIVYSQSLRARSSFSLESDFLKHCTKMKSWFLKRGYPDNMTDEEMKKVEFSEKGSNNSKASKGVPFVVTCHPSLNCLSYIIKDNLKILYKSHETKAVFSPGTVVSFRSTHRISSYLVRAKFFPLERCVGSRQCKRCRCKVCTTVTETYIFWYCHR